VCAYVTLYEVRKETIFMKLLRITIDELPLFESGTEIDFLTTSQVKEEEKHELIHLFNKFYLNKTLTFTGLNASGKTQILNVLSFVLNLIQAKSINSKVTLDFLGTTSNLLNLGVNQEAKFTVYFYDDQGSETLNKLEAIISRKNDDSDNIYRYFIESEKLSTKGIKGIRTKNDLFDFSHKKGIKVTRREEDVYIALSNDVSILNVFYNRHEYKKIFYRDLVGYTNFNVLSAFVNIPEELVQFLDPSVEYLKFNIIEKEGETASVEISLKFKYDDGVITLDAPTDLNRILSSGTVKGLGLFMQAIYTLRHGGLLLVDELENHFNREISSTLVSLFTDRKINSTGAILIYTTHYAELLDVLDRNDAIYIVNKTKKIALEKLSKILKRNDVRRSEYFVKGALNHSTLSYDASLNLKRAIKRRNSLKQEDELE